MAFKPDQKARSKKAIVTLGFRRLSRLADPKKIANKKTQNKLHQKIVALTLDLVRAGKSPVKRHGRFKAYAAQRKEAVGDYPKRVDGKNIRPVNLILARAGRPYLEAILQKRNIPGGIAFLEPKEDFFKILFNVHNEGARRDIPQRKVIPTGGDDYTAAISKAIKDIYLKRIRGIIKSN